MNSGVVDLVRKRKSNAALAVNLRNVFDEYVYIQQGLNFRPQRYHARRYTTRTKRVTYPWYCGRAHTLFNVTHTAVPGSW